MRDVLVDVDAHPFGVIPQRCKIAGWYLRVKMIAHVARESVKVFVSPLHHQVVGSLMLI